MARRTSHSPLRPAHDHFDREPHDDFGGFQGDLAATGKAMDRRQLLRLAATFGVGAGALQLMGCGDSTPSSPSPPSGGGGTGSTCSRIPEETAGPYPADGSNGPTPQRHGRGAQRHSIELCRTLRRRRWCAADDRADARVLVDVRAARRPRDVPVALRCARTRWRSSSFSWQGRWPIVLIRKMAIASAFRTSDL